MLIQSSRASATIQPVAGGRLASLIVDDMEILVTEGEKITRWGSFPMVPWAGRLGFGRLYFDDAMHTFPITSGAHANHGVALRQEWDVVSEAESTVTIRTSLADPWPFGGSVEQVFTVSDGALRIEMTITAGEVPMPAQFGWHPWYRRELDRGEPLSIEFAADKMYEVDDEQLVTGTLVTPPAGPWDDTFVEVTQQPVLHGEMRSPSRCHRISTTGSCSIKWTTPLPSSHKPALPTTSTELPRFSNRVKPSRVTCSLAGANWVSYAQMSPGVKPRGKGSLGSTTHSE